MGDKKVELSEVAEIIMGQSPKGETYNNFGDGYPLLNGPSEFGEIYPIPEKWTTDPKRFSKEGDILFCVRGSTGSMNWSDRDYSIGRGLCAIRAKTGKQIDTYYIYYSLLSNLPKLLNRGTGSVFPNLSKKDIHTFAINWPKKSIRRDIARKLRNLDEKIELNRQMNETLEAIARAIFKSWFVDFDPVKAKMAGEPYPLPDAVMALFPDELVESELGMIPKGWEVTKLGKLCKKPQYGFTESATNEDTGVKFLRITDINKTPWVDWSTVPYCKIDPENLRKYKVNVGDLLIARSADPGHSTIIENDISAVFASYLIRFIPKNSVHQRYLQYWMRSKPYWDLVHSRMTGSTRSNLNATMLREFEILVPPHELNLFFNRSSSYIRKCISIKIEENHSLFQIRNSLLQEMI